MFLIMAPTKLPIKYDREKSLLANKPLGMLGEHKKS